MRMMLGLWVALTLAACAPAMTTPEPPPGAGEPSLCRAEQYQRFVGQPRSRLPQAPAGETWRVTCSSCPVTMDYNPRRLNIVYDDRAEIVREVKCG